MALFMGAAAEGAGMAAITGAHVAGVALSRAAGEHLREGARVVVATASSCQCFWSTWVSPPVALTWLPASCQGGFSVVQRSPGRLSALALVRPAPALRGRSALAVGVGMIPRGEVSPVLAAFGAGWSDSWGVCSLPSSLPWQRPARFRLFFCDWSSIASLR